MFMYLSAMNVVIKLLPRGGNYYHRHVIQRHDCWSLKTLQNEDGIKEGNVLDNVTYLTVSQ